MKKITTSFETLPLNSGLQLVEGSMAYSVTQTVVRAREGTKSARFELRASDPQVQYGNKRAEITVVNNTSNPDTTVEWYRFSTYQVSTEWLTDSRREIFPCQFHDKSSTCSTSPAFAMVIENNRNKIDLRYSTANYCSTPSSKRYVRTEGVLSSDSGTLLDIGAVTFNKWVDWVINYKPRTDSTGVIKIWKDGVLVFSYTGPCHYLGSQHPYMKIGIYKWVWMSSVPAGLPTSRIGYIDSLAVGDTAESYDTMRLSGTTSSVNIAPTVTGVDVSGSSATATLSCTASDSDGNIVGYQWSQISGASANIGNANVATTTVSGLTNGLYTFRITVTDDKGASSYDDCFVNVLIPNQLPTVSIIESSPTRTVSLTAKATDGDGTIASYLWNNGATTSTVAITGIIGQVQVVTVTVTDNGGGTATASYTVTF